jgi:hypothetical protein
MGLDYVLAQAGKPWTKRWKGGRNHMMEPSLFDLELTEKARTVIARLNPGVRVALGDKLIVESQAGSLMLSSGYATIGSICNPTPDITDGVNKGGGYAEATIQGIGLFGDTAEISIR